MAARRGGRLEICLSASEADFVNSFCPRFERSENETQEMKAAAAAPSRIAVPLNHSSISFSLYEIDCVTLSTNIVKRCD